MAPKLHSVVRSIAGGRIKYYSNLAKFKSQMKKNPRPTGRKTQDQRDENKIPSKARQFGKITYFSPIFLKKDIMAYQFSPKSQNMTYLDYFCKVVKLAKLIDENEDLLREYFDLKEQIRDWDAFFCPNISISEVNNPNMGHIYMGKVRIPAFFARNVKGKLDREKTTPHVLTFVVCKYAEFPGPDFEKERKEIAMEKAMVRLSKVFEKRVPREIPSEITCGDQTFEAPLKVLPLKLKRIEEFSNPIEGDEGEGLY
jgi:hypothetical protein